MPLDRLEINVLRVPKVSTVPPFVSTVESFQVMAPLRSIAWLAHITKSKQTDSDPQEESSFIKVQGI